MYWTYIDDIIGGIAVVVVVVAVVVVVVEAGTFVTNEIINLNKFFEMIPAIKLMILL